MAEPDCAQESSALGRLDAMLENRLRLGACVLLARAEAISFSRLKSLLGATDGNLGAQLRKLEDAQYVSCRKEFVARKPVSWYALTPRGSDALDAHLAALESLIARARNGSSGGVK